MKVAKPKMKKTPLLLALEKMLTARDLLDAEIFAEKEKGYRRTNWATVGSLAHYRDALNEMAGKILGGLTV